MPELAGWANFYVIVGSSAGALIGLQFVVITLVAQFPVGDVERASSAFATPNVVHFGSVLMLACIASVPWHTVTPVLVLWGLLGFGGIVYELIVFRLMRTQAAYKPEFGDWVFYVALPFAAYGTLAWSAYAMHSRVREAMFGVGIAAVLLLFIGIHNAWDSVTYHVVATGQRRTG